jgi:CHAT domain-containing protein
LNNLAGLYQDQGDYPRAEPLFRQAMEIRKKVLGENHPDYATSLNNLAGLYKQQRDYARAEPLLRDASDICKSVLGENHPDYAKSLHNLALLYQAQGDYPRAEPLLRRALQIIRRQIEATAVVQSERQQLAMLQSVRIYLDHYLALAVQSGQFVEPAYGEMLAWKGVVLRRQRQARAAADNPELLAVFQQLQQVATQLAHLAWATPDPKEQARWRQRVEQLSSEKERLEAELSARSAAYRQAKRQVNLEELQAALPQDVTLVDFLEYSHYTPPDKQAGTKGTSERRLLAFVVGRGQPVQMIFLGAVQPVSQAIDTWRTEFGMSPEGAAAGQLLRQRIWEPIEAKLQGTKIVLLSPDGVLGRLPLGALPGKEPGKDRIPEGDSPIFVERKLGQSPSPGKYLLEEWALALVPVPQIIPELLTEEKGKLLKQNLLLLGNVDYDAQPGKAEPARAAGPKHFALPPAAGRVHFGPLPGTQGEVAAIEKLYRRDFGGEGIALLEQSRATKGAFLADAVRHRYLHVATHGFFAPESQRSALALAQNEPRRFGEMLRTTEVGGLHPGLLSGLALAGANRAGQTAAAQDADADAGILTAEEIGSMNMEGVELVMLSACETGLGQVAGGEGLLGLQRAFQSAGAHSVVASLWRVPDDATRALMVEFYQNLWQKKLGKLEALRQAQLTMLRQYDAKAGRLRGAGAVKPVDAKKLAAASPAEDQPPPSLPPYYWGAFVLSGDWR